MTGSHNAVEPLPGYVAVGLDSPLTKLSHDLFLGVTTGGSPFVITTLLRHTGRGEPRSQIDAVTWRGDGPLPRRRFRPAPGFATLGSLALGRDVRLARAYQAPGIRWRLTGPWVLLDGDWLRPAAVVAQLPAADAPRDAALARVADVRALYGRMLTDVAYRIENSALFDSTVALTSRFEAALVAWGDLLDDAPLDDLVRCSATVKVAFDAARANAETLGIGHLPVSARADARRAAGAARLANSGSPGEREAAEAQVSRLLIAIGLHWLPDPNRGALLS